MKNKIPSVLYRYFAIPNRDILTLKEGLVYYPEPAQLNDPFDCQISIDTNISSLPDKEKMSCVQYIMLTALYETGRSIKFSTNLDRSFQYRFNLLCEDFLTCMFKYGIHSLSESCVNQLMWSHYGSAFRGFVVAYDISKPIQPIVLRSTFQVQYQDKIPQLDILTLLNSKEDWNKIKHELLTTKGKAWSYEQEWRVIIWGGGRKERIPYKISEIIFGHLLEEKYCKELREIFGSEIKYKVAMPSEFKYKVELWDANSGRRRIPDIARPHRKRWTYFFDKK